MHKQTHPAPKSVNWGGRILNGVLALTLALALLPVSMAPVTAARIQPLLMQLARQDPDRIVSVIVQKTAKDDRVERAVSALGGKVTQDLHIINAFAAKLSGRAVAQLARTDGVRWVSIDAPMVRVSDESKPRETPATSGVVTRRADFDFADFSGQDSSWGQAWVEVGESDGPAAGDIIVTDFMVGTLKGLRLRGAHKGLQSTVDLAELDTAELSFAYRRKDFQSASDYISVEISNDGGLTWAEIDRLTGPATDEALAVAQYDLAPYGYPALGVRFLSSASFSSESKFYLDYVQVTGTVTGKATSALPYRLWLPMIAAETSGVTDGNSLVTPAKVKFDSAPKYVADWFSSAKFKNDDGTVNWTTDWIESDVNGSGASTGNVMITNGELWLDDNPDTATQPSLARSVDLINGAAATLSFNFRTTSGVDSDDSVVVEVSNNGGTTYTALETFTGITGAVSWARTYDISAFIATNTAIRFRVAQNYGSADESFIVDNVKVQYAPDTVQDQFDAVTYTGSDGLSGWSGPWVEYDPYGDNGAAGGYVRVEADQLRLDWWYAYEENITRSADLSGHTQAILSFDWETSGLDKWESVSVLVSNNGVWFTQLGTYDGSKSGVASFDISAFISGNTTIRFENRSTNWEPGEYVKIDNVQIALSGGCVQCQDAAKLKSNYPRSVKADQAWNTAKYLQGQNLTVAVIDSGIVETADLHAETGQSRVVARVQYASSTAPSDDFYGHGTHVAGIIAGSGLESRNGYVGIAPRANLIDVKVMDDTGCGLMSDVVAGLQWVYDHRAEYNIRVVNLSLNSTVAESYHTSPLDAAVEILWFNGIVVVASSGNAGANAVYPPGNDPFIISVGAVDDKATASISDDTVASFSAYGTPNGYAKPDLVAPGKDIVSLLSSDDNNLSSSHPANVVAGSDDSWYFRMSGTSMAAPVVSGAAVLLLQDEPNLTPDQVKYRLMATANKNWAGYTAATAGAGYLDIAAAVNGATTQSANTGVTASQLLWTGTTPVSWGSVQWGSVQWGSVQWGSVQWGSVQWGSVQWGSDYWGP
ncbi:MAG: S8 family serine peptidase [Chloroflexi bacterium]|nr:S8 family serine peptidase [Chloroflexota bacterium]